MNKQEAIALVRELWNFMATRPEIDEAIDMAIKALQDDWIPVSDRLPEADDDVNVTLKDFSETRTGFYSEESWWLITEQGTLENYPINYVVAWKPLPEPYNADMRGDKE